MEGIWMMSQIYVQKIELLGKATTIDNASEVTFIIKGVSWCLSQGI